MPAPENETRPALVETQARDSTSQRSGHAHRDIEQAHHGVSPRRLAILDPRLPHGAYRVLRYIEDRLNRNGQAWPTIRQIAADLNCKPASVVAWIKILQDCQYLAVERIGQNHNFRYTFLPGDGNVALPEWATRAARTRVAQKGNTKEILVLPQKDVALPEWATRAARTRVAQKGNTKEILVLPQKDVALPEWATPRVAPTGNVSNTKVVNHNKGESPPNLFPRELDKAIVDQCAALRRMPQDDALWKKLHDLETLKYGRPMTTRKPAQTKAPTVEASPSRGRSIGELPQEEREKLARLLRQSVDNPQQRNGDDQVSVPTLVK